MCFFFFGFSNGGFIVENEKRECLDEWVEKTSFDRIYWLLNIEST